MSAYHASFERRVRDQPDDNLPRVARSKQPIPSKSLEQTTTTVARFLILWLLIASALLGYPRGNENLALAGGESQNRRRPTPRGMWTFFRGFFALYQQRPGLDRGDGAASRGSGEELSTGFRGEFMATGNPILKERAVGPEPRRHVTLRWTSALAATLLLGTCLTPAASSADTSSQLCPNKSPLGGWVRLQRSEQIRRGAQDGCNLVVHSFMTFDLVPNGPNIEQIMAEQAAFVAQWPKLSPQARQQALNGRLARLATGGRSATKLKYKVWSSGCHDIGGDRFTCNAPGATASNEITLGEETPTGFKPFEQRTQGGIYSLTFNPMLPSLQISPGGSDDRLPQWNAMCVSNPRFSVRETGGLLARSGGMFALAFYIEPQANCDDPSNAASFCSKPTVCFKPTDEAQRRQCASDPVKFAALPFEGNMEHQSPDHIVVSKISWNVCCGCGQLPPPPDFPNEAQSNAPVMATHSTTWTITNSTAANWTLHSASLARGVWKSRPPQTIANGATVSFTAESHDPTTGDQGSVVYTPDRTPVPLANFVFSFDNPSIGTDSYTVLVPSSFNEKTTQQAGNNQVLTSMVK